MAVPVVATVAFFAFHSREADVDFNTDVKPIFNKKCIACHGGVRRKANFSLLFRADALAINKSGRPAIIPGDPDHSEMIRRISSNDPDERMPYKHDPLSKEEIATLKKWIRQGAKWGEHWAYVPVKEVTVPSVHYPGGRNEIDDFIYEKL
ncbi:MAG TPA: c-type cytochrome domain-containing protein, partial [Chitinophagaceae bacterium]